MQVWHFPGQKLRLGGDALGTDPTYLLYLPSGSRGELRRIDFAAWPRTATFRPRLPPASTRKPPVCRSGISRARSFDLEVTPWAPSRLTSCISHTGPEESSGASTLPPGPAQPPFRLQFSPESTTEAASHLTKTLQSTNLLLSKTIQLLDREEQGSSAWNAYQLLMEALPKVAAGQAA